MVNNTERDRRDLLSRKMRPDEIGGENDETFLQIDGRFRPDFQTMQLKNLFAFLNSLDQAHFCRKMTPGDQKRMPGLLNDGFIAHDQPFSRWN